MARRNVLQEIPIKVPQTERQLYDIIAEDEGSIPYSKQAPDMDRPHSRYISNDESKENITPYLFENILEKKSQVKVLDSGNGGAEPGPSSSSQTNDPSSGAGDLSTPQRKTEDPQPCDTPMDFSTVTVGDLGISTESFTTQCLGKSPKSLHKHRRRSTIGVRGSPEMNFLIRQIALQRSNRKNEPEPLDSPFTSPRNSILREKISAFRNAFQAVEETEGKPSVPGFSGTENLQSEKGKGEVRNEPPEKRKKLGDGPGAEASGARHEPAGTLCPSLEAPQKPVPEKTSEPGCSSASGSSTEVLPKPEEVQKVEAPTLPSSSRCRKRKVMFTGLLSPPEPEPPVLLMSDASPGPALKPALKKTPRRDFAHFRIGFAEESRVLFSLEESSDNEENEDINKPEDSMKRRKKVTFGRQLSPELFDRSLPANTPLRRGSTPYNHHKIEATPSEEQETGQSPCDPLPQPDFDDKEEVTLQPLSLCFDAESSDSDSPASISVPGPKEESNPVEEEEAAPHVRGSNDHKPVMSSIEPVEEMGADVSCADIIRESLISPPEVSPAGTRKLRSKRKMSSTEETLESNGSKAAGTTKVKSTVKKGRKPTIAKKLLIKASRGRGKKKGGKSKKSMQKPVYSEREGISKKPLLSPIPELPECIPTPPASTSRDFAHGKGINKHVVKKVRARAGKVLENNVHLAFEDSLERDVEEKETETSRPCVVEEVKVDPALEDMKASNTGSPEKSDDLPASDVLDLADPISRECPPSPTHMEGTDPLPEPTTSGPAPSLEEKKSKAKNTKRRSTTRKYTAHASESTPHVTSEMTLTQDEDLITHKPKKNMEDPVQRIIVPSPASTGLSQETTSSSLSCISTHHKKSRRSSRIHQTPTVSSANVEPNAPGEHHSAALPHVADHPDFAMIDFLLPIDEALQFPQQEKKVRRSMRLRRDSGVIGLSWVQDNAESEPTGRRKSLSLVTRHEESSELSLGNTVHSPNKENISSCPVPNIARRTRRRTLGTTTIQENLSTTDTKRRRSSCYQKTPNVTTASGEDVHSTLLPDA